MWVSHAERLPQSICVPSLVLIVHVVFILEHRHADRHTYKVTDATDHPIHAIGYTSCMNNWLVVAVVAVAAAAAAAAAAAVSDRNDNTN